MAGLTATLFKLIIFIKYVIYSNMEKFCDRTKAAFYAVICLPSDNILFLKG